MNMYKLLLSFLFVLISSVSFAQTDPFNDPGALKTLKKGKVWVKTTFEKGEKSAESYFRAWIPFPVDQVWKVFIDTNAYKVIHKDYKDSQTLDKDTFYKLINNKPETIEDFYKAWHGSIVDSFDGREEGKIWSSYAMQYLNLPWPFKDRWNILKVKNDETKKDEGKYSYHYRAFAGNFVELHGEWEVFSIGDKPGWTEFRGHYKANAGIALPKFITKAAMKKSMRKSVKEKIEYLQKINQPKIEVKEEKKKEIIEIDLLEKEVRNEK